MSDDLSPRADAVTSHEPRKETQLHTVRIFVYKNRSTLVTGLSLEWRIGDAVGRPGACTIGNMDLFRVAVVQAGSVPFDRERSTMKALDLTGQAIRSGARLIVFPEAFISGYPKGTDFGACVGMRSAVSPTQ
jgi:hypothetical protein